MRQVFKIALPGYNAFTDTNPDHFALYVDPDDRVDYVLIKEKSRRSVSVPASGSVEISHGLGYVPFCLVFYESSSGVFRKVHGATDPTNSNPHFTVTNTSLTLKNPTALSVVMKYYIFYDEVA